MPENRYVLLDRDGVINHDSDEFIKSPEQWLPIEGSLEAIALFNKHGYKVVVITNQSGLARGLLDAATLENIHAKMQRMAAEKGGKIDAIYFCPHGPDDGCSCRKPKPGLLETFAADNNVNLSGIAFIGDSLRDLQAAQAAGASPILVKTGKGRKTLTENPNLDIPVFENLYDAAKHLTSRP
ncbi:MAG: D-glycero-beta-D-manno-heptose 1,7-bisphosphate 7-phosphatase [Methylobacter sp.]|jgi:D-glycero-D-manno-heptose 1,7-bisphosphate phosphatase|uniref:D-glycero-beta-D-manno-heptose 1,7-bisphosphate 7-phosphatase n=1 Tax=Methylobacter sp. TaxID=2051955 RepID=UPI0025E373CB|nr:D-glycero-beta-D-manno-heptose 1,7-bisphosphate 7-phosphatase [Methylobacter sp.]MCK9619083.1 D-glycero-beta-D-manno-heptose 1,7-bisphosphate 7-phosphatase [Methylobacter sp.]